MAKQKGGKVQKVITIIKARGKPDEVRGERNGQPELQPKPEPAPIVMTPPPLPKSKGVRITPKRPRIR